ncbi:VCBS domain-containing protein, partial [Colwellia sp. E2M01]|uniref:VCBS domain-containing protein n=1 Tax=Colwellia sp. E2M01 TaxID=2841561 RepID=UPI001C09CBBE
MKKQTIAKALLPMLLLGAPAQASTRNLSRSNKNKFKAISVKSTVADSLKNSEATDTRNSNADVNPFNVFGTNTNHVNRKIKVQEDVLSYLEEEGLLLPTNINPNVLSGELGAKQYRKEFAHDAGYNHCHITWGTYFTNTSTYFNATNCASYPGTWHAAVSYATVSNVRVSNKTTTTVTVDVSSNQEGTVHVVLLESTKTAPSTAQVQAGTDGSGAAATDYQTASTISQAATLNFTGMTAGKSYIAYIVVINASNEQPAEPTSYSVMFNAGLVVDSTSWTNATAKVGLDGERYFHYKDATSPYAFHIKKFNGTSFVPVSSFSITDIKAVNSAAGSIATNDGDSDLLIDANGDVHFVFPVRFSDASPGPSPSINGHHQNLWYGKYSSGSWAFQEVYTEADSGISNRQISIGEVSIALDSDGKVHASFSVDQSEWDGNGSNDVVEARYVTDASGSWVNTLVYSNARNASKDFGNTFVLTSSNGTEKVVFQNDFGTAPKLNSPEYYVMDSSSPTAKVLFLAAINDPGNYMSGMLLDSNGYMHYVYNSDNKAYYGTNKSGSHVSTEITRSGHTNLTSYGIQTDGTYFYIAIKTSTDTFIQAYDGTTWFDGNILSLNGNLKNFELDTTNNTIILASEDSGSYDAYYHTGNLSDYVETVAANVAPVITNLGGDSFTYTEDSGAVIIDQGTALTLTDADSADFDTGNLTVTITSGEDAAEDLIALNTAGSVSLSGTTAGSNVSVGGTVIGTLANNITVGNDFVVDFNASATPANIQELLKAITYTNTDSAAPTTGARNVRVTVSDGDGSTSANQNITITVAGANDPATIGGDITGGTIEDNGTNATGTLTVTDVDINESSFTAQTSLAKTYGTFSINAAGAWSYALNNANANVQALVNNGTMTDIISVTSADGTQQNITITITGVNGVAAITGTATGAAT